MRRQRGLVGLTGLAALVGLAVVARPSAAIVTTEQSASILVFPKVIADGTRDTIIQITNTSNNMRHAHCFYVNAAPTIPGLPPGPLNPPLWTEIDFDIWLTKQQPTHWVVSAGRLQNPADASCTARTTCDVKSSGTDFADCCDAGFDPGRVPPVAPDFTGELKCIEVDSTGGPISGNSLKGEATIEDLATGDVSKYNAIGIRGNDNNNGDNTLCLGGNNITNDCPRGAEYDGCPAEWRLDIAASGAPDPVVEERRFCESHPCSSIDTNLTIVPCTENFETQAPTAVTLQFEITNEFEQTLSASTTVVCWGSFDLGAPVGSLLPGISDAFNAGTLGGSVLQVRMRSAAGTPGGVLAVIEETHNDFVNLLTARSAQNGHTIGEQPGTDIITIPVGQGGDQP